MVAPASASYDSSVCGRPSEGAAAWKGARLYLFDLEAVAAVRVGGVVAERVGADKVVVGRRGGNDVAVAGDLAGEAGDGAGDWRTG